MMAGRCVLYAVLVFVASAFAVGIDTPSVNLSYSIYKASTVKVTPHFDFLGMVGD